MKRTPLGIRDRNDEDEKRKIEHLRSLTPEQRWYVMARLVEGIHSLRTQTSHLRIPAPKGLSESACPNKNS